MDDRLETGKLFDDGVICRAEAEGVFQPYLGHIASCIGAGIRAWEVLQTDSPPQCVPLASRTIAGLVHDHMVEHARRLFSQMQPQVMTSGAMGFLVVDFHGRLKLRFKKLSRRLHPYNVATYQQRACEDQTLFDAAATFVTAGYRTTDLGEFQDAHIVCWSASELRWSIFLPDILERRQTIPAAPEPDVAGPVVRPKKLGRSSAQTAS